MTHARLSGGLCTLPPKDGWNNQLVFAVHLFFFSNFWSSGESPVRLIPFSLNPESKWRQRLTNRKLQANFYWHFLPSLLWPPERFSSENWHWVGSLPPKRKAERDRSIVTDVPSNCQCARNRKRHYSRSDSIMEKVNFLETFDEPCWIGGRGGSAHIPLPPKWTENKWFYLKLLATCYSPIQNSTQCERWKVFFFASSQTFWLRWTPSPPPWGPPFVHSPWACETCLLRIL